MLNQNYTDSGIPHRFSQNQKGSSSWLSAQRGSRFMKASRQRGAGAAHSEIAVVRFVADGWATRECLERIGAHGALIIDWLDDAPLDAVPLGQLADRIVAFLRERREDHQALITWRERNRHALREFWARAPADALGVKQELEKALAPDGKPTT
jgi:hypothetical protein